MRLKMLMWKDFRQQRRFLVASFVLLAVPYLIAVIVFAGVRISGQLPGKWFDYILWASVADVSIGILLFGFFPANAIAGERADHSAEFFAYLPIRRMDAVISKAAVSLALSTAVIGTCIGLTYLVLSFNPNEPSPSADDSYFFFVTLVSMFGVAWMVSSFASSATFAAVAGVVVPISLWVAVNMLLLGPQSVPETRIGSYYAVSCLVLGLGSFAFGVWHYIRRVGP